MKIKALFLSILVSYLASSQLFAQLEPFFSIDEYEATLKMNFCQMGKIEDTTYCKPKDWDRIYRSKVVGMDNRFDLWLQKDKNIIGISMRGTTPRTISWLENFYAGMIPAKGRLVINDSTVFDYGFGYSRNSSVHVGWTYALGSIHHELLDQVSVHYQAGVRDFLIFGHSQGGAMSYLCYMYFHYLQEIDQLEKDIRIKMVSSAAPKVGNIQFAYDFERQSELKWAFNVVNANDWIPLMPFTVQTTEDMTPTQPFKFIETGLKSRKFFERLVLTSIYKSVDRKTKKARKALKKNLGHRVGQEVKKNRPQFQVPDLNNTMHYCRAGSTIVLDGDSTYFNQFPYEATDIFTHHMLEPYLLLIELNRQKFSNSVE